MIERSRRESECAIPPSAPVRRLYSWHVGSSEPRTWGDDGITAPTRASEEEPTLAAGTVLAGRYAIERLIGEGGMGEVYLGRHQTIDKLVAIKLLAPERARRPRTVSRFLQEAKAASKIRHEHIVDITDFGEVDGLAFFVMEYLDGEDLSDIVKREGRISWDRARAITIQILEGLGAAHDVGIVHRDVKPHNCFITPRERNPNFVKIIDFGIAKLRDGQSEEQLTQTGAIMGTADYMSPEQGQGMELDGRSDLYSVGVILYRMLVGRVPFKAGNPMATVYQHVHNAATPPSQACPEANLGKHVDALVLKALAKDPEERFATAAEFIEALKEIDDASPRGASKRWSPAAIGGLVAGALAVGGLAAWLATAGETPGPQEPATVPAVAQAEVPAPAPEPEPEPAAKAPEPEPAPKVDPTPPPAPEPAADEPSPEPDPTPEPADAKPDVPQRRSGKSISQTLSKLSGKVSACGKKAGLFPGELVDVTVSIATQGRASKVDVKGSHAKAGAACIVKAIERARFGPAQRSQTVKHRFKI